MATKRTKKAEPAAETPSAVTSIKGFNTDLACRGYQFEIGKIYEHTGKVGACEGGFHACPVEHHPLSVFEYYPPAGSRYMLVTQDGERDASDTKLASAKITLDVEISLGDLTKRAIDWVFSRAKWADGPVVNVWAGIVGRDGIKADTFYTLRDGKPVEAE
ncbi:hypothetical protein OIU35_31790 [Boseaceae bacterium BT-24-1]|nr:hypothetical protein [Boseaceae bacterium BT-24-1]